MKRIIFLWVLFITPPGFSVDRHYVDEKIEEVFSEVNENLVKTCLELQKLNQQQIQIIELLNSINLSVKSHEIEVWSQTDVFSPKD